MRNRYFLFLLISMFFVVMVGCAAPGSAPSEKKEENSTSDKGTTLKIGGIQYPYTKAVIKEFENHHPNIDIKFTEGSIDFEDGTIQATLRSGTGPDVMVASSGPARVGMLGDAGLILSLDDIYEKYRIEDRYQDWVIDQIRTQGDGKVFEVVEGVDVFQVYYNKDMFEKIGVDAPKTWEEFIDICAKLKDEGIQPISLGVRGGIGGGWFLGNIVEASAGQERMSEVIYGEGRFDQEEIVLGGKMYKELADQGFINAGEAGSIDQNQAEAAFVNGQAAMNISPQGIIIDAEVDGIDTSKFDSFLLPTREEGRPSRPSAGLAHSWIVNSNTDNLEAAGEWLDWVSSEDYLKVASENGAVLVPVVKAADNLNMHPAIEDAVQKIEKGAGYNPSVYLPAGVKDAWYAATQGILSGEFTPEEAMKGVQKELEAKR